jgi:predicted O-linked N-acetylglucosamine transferase (SPINDLY family)
MNNDIRDNELFEFNNLYNRILTTTNNKFEIFPNIFNIVQIIFNKSKDNNIKENILSRMIIIYPEEHVLYFMMGILFKNISIERSIMWFKLCYSKKPNFYENIVELSALLIKNNMKCLFFELNKDNLFDELIKLDNNHAFLNIYASEHMQVFYYKNVVKCYLKMIKQMSNKKSSTIEEKHNKWWCYHHLGYMYCFTGQIQKSIEYTKKAYELSNKFELNIETKLLSFQNFVAFHDFEYNNHLDVFNYHLEINNYLKDDTQLLDNMIHSKKNNKKKINIGYVSADFLNHSVTNFIIPILKNHNRERFEIFLFCNTETVSEHLTNIVKNSYPIHSMNAKTAAKFINNKKIDILFELHGHTVKNRLDVFALNPAPIQITYLGYPNTTGLKSIKYRLTDPIADDINTKQLFSEELIRLPRCFLLFESAHFINRIIPKKTDKSNIILAAMNKENKISKKALETWKIILEECPNTKILIKLESLDNNEERLEYYSKSLSVGKERIILINKLSNEQFAVLFTKFDILLDTFPYTGTTITCEVLYNSIPMVTMRHKDYHSHNVSASILINSGLSELVATCQTEYIEIVKRLTREPELIDQYKKIIHSKFMIGMNPKEFMNSYENKLEEIYNNYSNYIDLDLD